MPDPNETTTETTTPAAGEKPTEDVAAELERTRIALKAANKESAERRKKLEELEKAEQDRKAAEMSELEKWKSEADKAKADREAALKASQETMLKAAFLSEAALAGLQHPEDAYLLADKSGVEMTDGQVSGVKEAIQALIKAERVPLAKRTAPGLDAGAGGGENPKDKPKPLTDEELRAARRMGVKPEDYQKYKTK